MESQVIVEENAIGAVTFHFPQMGQSFLFSPQNAFDALQEFMVKFGDGTRHVFEAVAAKPEKDQQLAVKESDTHGPDPAGVFHSAFNINDNVEFRPMYRHQQAMGIADETMPGEVKAVRFTEAKIFYDIYSPYHGVIFDGVDSGKVYSYPKAEVLQEVQIAEPAPRNS